MTLIIVHVEGADRGLEFTGLQVPCAAFLTLADLTSTVAEFPNLLRFASIPFWHRMAPAGDKTIDVDDSDELVRTHPWTVCQ
jgi:hypothetical protein